MMKPLACITMFLAFIGMVYAVTEQQWMSVAWAAMTYIWATVAYYCHQRLMLVLRDLRPR